MPGDSSNTAYAAKWRFAETHWSIIARASEGGSSESANALELLCRTYWFPIYAFVRRRGYPEHEAEDLTQGFFARLLEKDFLRAVDPAKGKFRSYLLAALEHFLAKEWRRANAQKRGGGVTFVSLDGDPGEPVVQVPASNLTPEQFYDQQWFITMLEQVIGKLQREFQAAGKGLLFQDLKTYLTGEKPESSYAQLAASLEMTEAALKTAVSRMRHRYRELLRGEIAKTVSRPEEIEEELQALFASLSA